MEDSKEKKQALQVAKIIRSEAGVVPNAYDGVKWFFVTLANIIERVVTEVK